MPPMTSVLMELVGASNEEIADTLERAVIPMLRNGVEHALSECDAKGAWFHYRVKSSHGSGIYLDGEGRLVIVSKEGTIVAVIDHQGNEDETVPLLRLSAGAWAEAHGGLRDLENLRGTEIDPTEGQIEYLARKLLEHKHS